MNATYDSTLVALSVAVAVLASFTALDLAGRVAQSRGRAARLWLIGGSIAMGAGIWSMHFVGMLAFSLPIPLAYDVEITLVSLAIAIVISGFALAIVSEVVLEPARLALGGVVLGLGICAMHYTGMQALLMVPPIRYDRVLFAASVAIAIGVSMAALWLAFEPHGRRQAEPLAAKLGAALLMGMAISGMHYTAMAAADFVPGGVCLARGPGALSGASLGFTVTAAIIVVLTLTLLASLLDARLARHRAQMLQSVERANRELRQEIQAREEAQRSMRESEQRFRTAFEFAPVGMTLVGLDGRLLRVNAALCRILGYSDGELLACGWAAVTHPDDLAADRAQFARLARGEIGTYRAEMRYRHKRGDVVWALMGASLIRDAAGTPSHAVVQIQDVTQQRLLSEELQRRTQELERSNRELEQFAYVASHDLQAPLRSISGFVQLLDRRVGGTLDLSAHEYLHYIADSAAGMHRLIEALLDLGRVGHGGVKCEATDLRKTMAQVRERLRALIAERGAVVAEGELPTVVADPTLMVQLLQNLVSNAIKFQTRRPPEVRIDAWRRNGGWVVAVADRGIGIEARYFQRIFEVFQRLHTAEEYEGSGVGLAICEKIVRLHGGRIWVESIPGEGSTFYFSLPQHAAAAPDPAARGRPPPYAASAKAQAP